MTVHRSRTSLQLTWSFAVVLGTLAGCSVQQDPQLLLTEARQYAQSGNRKAAIIQLKNVLEQEPRNVEARERLAQLYIQSGDPLSAEKEIRKAIENGLSAAQGWPTLAQSLLMQRQFQKVLDESPKDKASDARSLSLQGDAYLALGKPELAASAYEHALQRDPASASALLGRARLHAVQRDLPAAYRDLEQVIAKDGRNADAWLLQGHLLKGEGKLEPARAAYTQAVQADAHHIEVHLAKAYVEIGMEKFAQAQHDIDMARKTGAHPLGLLHAQALLDYTQGQPKRALDSVLQVLRTAPDHLPSLLLAGLIQKQLGAMQQAEDYLTRYLDQDPDNLHVTKQLASVLLANSGVRRASQLIDTALKKAPGDATLLALAGQVSLQEKHYEQAMARFEKAARITPESAKLQTALAVTNLAQGDYPAAISALEKATRIDKQSIATGILLVNSRILAKQYDAALAEINKLHTDHPNHPALANLAGQVYLKQHHLAKARTSFEKALALEPTFFPAAASLAKLDLQEDKPDVAQQRFVSILEKDKDNMSALLALAELATARGKRADATAWLEKAYRVNPKHAHAAMLLAQQYLAAGQSDKAMTLAKAVAVHSPDSADALELLARVQFALKDKDGATETLSRRAKLDADPAAAQGRIALLHVKQGEFGAAQEAVNRALVLNPDDAGARYLNGMLKIRHGNATDAHALARTLQKDQPNSAYGFLLEGEASIARNDPAAAARSFETALRLDPTTTTLVKLHRSLERAGQGAQAQERLDRWLATHPNDLTIRALAAEYSLTHAKYATAITHYEALVQSNPVNVMALNNLAFAYHAVNDSRAIVMAEKAYTLAADNPAVLDTLGWILLQRGERNKALPLLRKAHALLPTSKDIKQHLEQAEKS